MYSAIATMSDSIAMNALFGITGNNTVLEVNAFDKPIDSSKEGFSLLELSFRHALPSDCSIVAITFVAD